MLRITQLKLPAEHTGEQFHKKLLDYLKIREKDLKDWSVRKRSLDARKKPDLYYVYTVDCCVKNEKNVLTRLRGKAVRVTEEPYRIPEHGPDLLKYRPVVVGSGPAGLFCAYLLAEEGYAPVVIERGAPVRERIRDVEKFWESGILDTSSNVQFGEGGAGTFSDGKLNTLVKDPNGRNRFVLETFVRFGASDTILWEQKPHIGTDVLTGVVERMREHIIDRGGEFRYHTQVTDLEPDTRCLILNGGEKLRTDAAVLAIGHSARDTFDMLFRRGIVMEPKSFAVGVRVEHPQDMIDRAMYGRERGGDLPAASYKLAEKLQNGRGVYTFCMCPGGYVVNASSEEGRIAVNGMSYHARDGKNANSAVIVTVTKEDFGSDHALAGVEFQRKLEQRAWEEGNGSIPVQKFGDYCRNRISDCFGSTVPETKGSVSFGNVRKIFPEELAESIEEGIRAMGRRISGFDSEDTVLSGVESRTSSPVKILRDPEFRASVPWIYPCGEGAGYAGGITSAAMDGMKTAEKIISGFSPDLI